MTLIPRTDLDVYPLCLGGNVFGWTADEQQSFAVLDAYVAGGGNFVDTAEATRTGRRATWAVSPRPSSATGWPAGAAGTTW